MSNDVTNEDLELQAQALEQLKIRADRLGVKYHPSIGMEKLREKIAEFEAGQATESEEPSEETPVAARPETENERRQRIKDEANKLVRVRVSCMNPYKREWEGEILTSGNTIVGTVKKYVPFNVEWHVPQILLNMLQERMCQIFVSKKTKHGVTVREGKLIKEFAIEILDPLTPEELKDLAQQQAMANRVG